MNPPSLLRVMQWSGGVAFVLALSVGSALGSWSEPVSGTVPTPNDSLPGALNTGTKLNEKTGPLIVGASAGNTPSLVVHKGTMLVGVTGAPTTDKLQLGGDLYITDEILINGTPGSQGDYLTKTSGGMNWKSGSMLTEGFGIDILGNVIDVDPYQVQLRVVGSCPSGTGIAAIGPNGFITCH